jgi:hypothetical protein
VFTRALLWSLSWATLIQFIPSHPISLRSILILSTHTRLGLPSGLFPRGFSYNIPYAFPFCPIRATCLAHSRGSVQVRGFLEIFVTSLFFYGEELLSHSQPASWKTTPCWLSMTAYLVYWQLPSISGGRLIHPQPEDASRCGDNRPN